MKLCRLEAENRPPQFIDLLHVNDTDRHALGAPGFQNLQAFMHLPGDIGVYVLIIVSPGCAIGYTNANAAQVTVQLVRVIGYPPVAAT